MSKKKPRSNRTQTASEKNVSKPDENNVKTDKTKEVLFDSLVVGSQKPTDKPSDADMEVPKSENNSEQKPSGSTENTSPSRSESENNKDKKPRNKKQKNPQASDVGDQMMEIIDDALNESSEDLGLTDDSAVSISNVGVSNILTVLFGLVVLGFAIFGIISAAAKIKDYTDAKKANLDKIQLFENLILPLCASDAPTFDGASSLNGDVAIAAACWDIILSPASNYTAENGYYTISYLDVEIRINKLFGKGVTYTHTSVGDQEIAFEYDEDSGMYTIPAYPRILAYFPTVDGIEPIENGYRLTVSYHSPVTNWITAKNPTDKVMIYTVTGSGLVYNVSAIEVGEIFNTQNL